MNSDQLDFVTYCIGNLSIRLQLPQKAIYARLKSTGIFDDRFDGSIDKAVESFYNSVTAQMIQDESPTFTEKRSLPCR